MRNIEELREAIAQSRNGQSHWRCPTDLREEAVGYCKSRQSAGDSLGRIAQDLGMSGSGLKRWLQKADGSLKPVRLKEDSPKRDGLILVTPLGYRLEGLSVATATDLLQRLGC